MTEKIVGRLIDTNLELAGGINNRLPAVFDTVNVKVKSITYPNMANMPDIFIDGVKKTTNNRGYHLVRLDEFANFVDVGFYDVYGDVVNANNLIDVINSTPTGYTLILNTSHDGNVNSSGLRTVLTSLGFTLTGPSNVWTSLCMWYGVIQVGSGHPLIENYKIKTMDGDFIEETIEIPKGIIHFPLDDDAISIQGITPYKYCPKSIRYIRDWVNNSTRGGSDIWTEIEAIDIFGTNIALNKPVTTNSETLLGPGTNDITRVTNGNTDSAYYYNALSPLPTFVIVDLGGLFEINTIKLWHYYIDDRIFYDTKTEVSVDGKTWYPVFDSAIEGTYVETINGKTIELFSNMHLDENGLTVEDSSSNILLASIPLTPYNNFTATCPSTFNTLSEKYKNENIYRVGITPDETKVTDFRTTHLNHGIRTLGVATLFKALTKYVVSIYWRPVNKDDISVALTPSDVGPWVASYTESVGDGWMRTVAYRDGTASIDKSGIIFAGFRCPSAEVGEPILIDWSCLQLEENRIQPTEYTPRETIKKSYPETLQIPLIKKSFPFTLTMEINPLIKDGSNSNEGTEKDYVYFANAFKSISGELVGQFEKILRSRTDIRQPFRYTIVFKDSIFWDSYINDIILTEDGRYHGMVDHFIDVSQPINSDRVGTVCTIREDITSPTGEKVISISNSETTLGINWYINHTTEINKSEYSKYFSFSFYVKRSDSAVLDLTSVGSLYLYRNLVSDNSRISAGLPADSIEDFGDGWYKYTLSRESSELCYVDLCGSSGLAKEHEWFLSGWKLTSDKTRLFELDHLTLGTKIDNPSVGFANARYSNITYYDRALTQEDIIKLSDPNFQILSTGDLIVQAVDQKPAYVPTDAYYFPLDTKTSSDMDLGSVTNSSNVSFPDGSILVGRPYTNLAPNPLLLDNVSWEARTNVTVAYGETDPFGYKNAIRIHPLSTTDNFFTSRYDTLGIGIHTVSVWLKATKPILNRIHVGGSASGSSFSFPVDITTEWKEFIYTGELTIDPISLCMGLGGWNTWSDNTVDIWFAYPQITQSTGKLPFIDGVGINSYLQFNLNSYIQLDWSKDWTLFYNKKPLISSSTDTTGYSCEMIGSNGNANAGRGYAFWGKWTSNIYNYYVNGYTTATRPVVDVETYFNNWHSVVVLKRGNEIINRLFLKDGSMIEFIMPAPVDMTPDFYVVGGTYDLSFNGFSSDVALYRDLIILKRAMTDEEIDNLFRAHMSFSKDNKILNVSGGITTNKNIE